MGASSRKRPERARAAKDLARRSRPIDDREDHCRRNFSTGPAHTNLLQITYQRLTNAGGPLRSDPGGRHVHVALHRDVLAGPARPQPADAEIPIIFISAK